MLRTLIRNIASNWAAFAVQVIVMLFLTPFVLKSLGPTRYAIWALVTSITGYYGLLELGFRPAMGQYMTRYLAKRDFMNMNATASTGFVVLACCGSLVALSTLLLAWLAPVLFRIPPGVAVETQLCILFIGLSAAIGFASYPFSAVFVATQRFDISNGVVIAARLLSAAAVVVALRQGYGLVALSIILAVTSLLRYCTMWQLAYYVLPELSVSPRLASRECFSQIIRYGVWSFIISCANILKSRVDIILIGILLPIEAVVPYALALSMAEYLSRLFMPIGSVLFPVMTDLDARGEYSRLNKVYLLGSKMLMLLSIGVGFLSAAWAADFFHLWIRTDVTDNGTYPPPETLYYILMVAAVCTASQRIGQQVCTGTRRMKSLTVILFCEATLNIGLSIVLVHRFGLIGIAVGTLIPAILFQTIVLPANVIQILGIKITDYLRHSCVRPLLTLFAQVCIVAPIIQMVVGVTSWPKLLVLAALTGVVLCIPMLLIGLDRIERRRYVWKPLFNLGRHMGWSN